MNIKNLTPILSLVVAISALALSQLRPVYEYFETAEILVRLSDSIAIEHQWGSVVVTGFVHARNTGQAKGFIRRMEIVMEKIGDPNARWARKASNIITAQARTPFEQQTMEPFGQPAVDAEADWTKMVVFLDIGEISDPRKQARINNFFDQLEVIRNPTSGPQLAGPFGPEFELPEHLLKRAKSIVSPQLRNLTIGDYRLRVRSWIGESSASENDGEIRTICYKFFITREQIQNLQPPAFYLPGRYQPYRFLAVTPIEGESC